MSGLIQLAGAVMVLAAFVAAQFGLADPRSRASLSLNLLGSALLAAVALIGSQWGFLLLEGTWAVVSAFGLAHRSRDALR